MKSFYLFLLERTMSSEEALKVLGLQRGYTSEQLKTAYRNLSRQHHPDVGGSTALMQQINVAYSVLRSTGGSSEPSSTSAPPKDTYAQREERAAAYAKIAEDLLMSHLDVAKFQLHLATVFGETIHALATVVPRHASYGTYVNYFAEFSTPNRSIVCTMNISVDFSELYGKPSLSDPESMLSMSISTDILYQRKSVKLTQSRYRFERTHNVLENPEILFPAAKLKAQTAKSSSRKFSKRDALLIFTKELRGKADNEWVHIPVGAWELSWYRSTILGSGSWMCAGVYDAGKGHKKVFVPITHILAETEDTINYLADALKKLQEFAPESVKELGERLNAILERLKARR